MRITEFDEYPFHQHPTPFHIPYTSDVHFNDGYFCAAFSDDWYVVAGVRLHPNMNVIDGFAGIARKGLQHVLRASRALRPDAGTLAVGPLRIDVLRPMREVRIALADNDGGFAFDLRYEARSAPHVEAPYRFRKYGHLIHDMLRYTQVCQAHGRVTLDGESVEAGDWVAIRDHSWGVRAGMGPATPHGGTGERDEDEHGRPLDFEGGLDYPDGRTGLLSLPESKRLGATEFPCHLTGPDGETGMVHFEHHVFGHYLPYGF